MAPKQSVETPMLCPTTFGREAQLARLSQLVDQVLDGHGTSVLVTGEAGVGKTRVVGETRAVASRRGVRVLEGSAFELDRALPYGPITDLFRTFLAGKAPQAALDELGPAVVPLARLLPVLAAWLPQSADPFPASGLDQKQQTLEGFLLAFDRLIQRDPTMVVIEDVQWADEASLDLLLHLARSAAARPLLLILMLRTEDASPSVIDWRFTLERQRLIAELPLLPLGRSDLEAMIGCILGGHRGPTCSRRLLDSPKAIHFSSRSSCAPRSLPRSSDRSQARCVSRAACTTRCNAAWAVSAKQPPRGSDRGSGRTSLRLRIAPHTPRGKPR